MRKFTLTSHQSFRMVCLRVGIPIVAALCLHLNADQTPDWQRDIEPILNDHCVKCHGPLKTKADLDLSTFHGLIKGGENGPIVKAGDATSSSLYNVLLEGSDPHMPPKKQVPPEAIQKIQNWINAFKELPLTNEDEWKQETAHSPLAQVETVQPPSGLSGHQIIDFFIERRLQSQGIAPTQVCDDRTFQRRLFLDLVGRPPTMDESDYFLRSPEIQKRSIEVDRLLMSEEFANHFAELFDTMLMERRGKNWENRRRSNGWHDYLKSVFIKNRPWDEVVRELIVARRSESTDPGAIWFLYERENNHQAMAEAVAPVVFGTQVKCAQCHDHPLANEIKQGHYWGMVAAFNRSKNVDTQSGIGIAESAIGGFISFANLKKESQPATLNFLNGVKVPEKRPEPNVKEEDLPEYYLLPPPPEKAKPEKPAIPKFSRREKLAAAVTENNPLLAKSTVNRIWALMMGRGLVHPVDEMNSTHPASHPSLLEWLAKDFERSGYDIHHLIRTLANSETYQRSSWSGPDRPAEKDTFAWSNEKPLTAEVIYRSLLVACGYHQAENMADGKQLDSLRQSFIQHFPDVLPVNYNASLQQAMFLSNSPLIDALLNPKDENTTQAVLSKSSEKAKVELAFLRVYGRLPDSEEMDAATKFLNQRNDRPTKAVKQLLWAMLTSAEFLTNH